MFSPHSRISELELLLVFERDRSRVKGERIEELKLLLRQSEEARTEELRGDRLRESDFLNRIMQLTQLAPVPPSDALYPKQADFVVDGVASFEEGKLAVEDEVILSAQAHNYCSATIGENYTKEDFDEVLLRMRKNPEEWLND